MIYQLTVTTAANTLATNPQITNLFISRGLVYKFELEFPAGSAGLLHVAVHDGSFQVWPANPLEDFSSDDNIISFEDTYFKNEPPFIFPVRTFNLDDTHPHTCVIRIGLVTNPLYITRYIPGATDTGIVKAVEGEAANFAAFQQEVLSQPLSIGSTPTPTPFETFIPEETEPTPELIEIIPFVPPVSDYVRNTVFVPLTTEEISVIVDNSLGVVVSEGVFGDPAWMIYQEIIERNFDGVGPTDTPEGIKFVEDFRQLLFDSDLVPAITSVVEEPIVEPVVPVVPTPPTPTPEPEPLPPTIEPLIESPVSIWERIKQNAVGAWFPNDGNVPITLSIQDVDDITSYADSIILNSRDAITENDSLRKILRDNPLSPVAPVLESETPTTAPVAPGEALHVVSGPTMWPPFISGVWSRLGRSTVGIWTPQDGMWPLTGTQAEINEVTAWLNAIADTLTPDNSFGINEVGSLRFVLSESITLGV